MKKKTKIFLLERWPLIAFHASGAGWLIYTLYKYPLTREDLTVALTMLRELIPFIVSIGIFIIAVVLISLYKFGIEKARILRDDLDDEE